MRFARLKKNKDCGLFDAMCASLILSFPDTLNLSQCNEAGTHYAPRHGMRALFVFSSLSSRQSTIH
jgi:hypothetical protein